MIPIQSIVTPSSWETPTSLLPISRPEEAR